MQFTRSLKHLVFNPCAYEVVKTWFQSLLFQVELVWLYTPAGAASARPR
jgi:hypothetical protein